MASLKVSMVWYGCGREVKGDLRPQAQHPCLPLPQMTSWIQAVGWLH